MAQCWLTGICALLAEILPRLYEENDKEAFYRIHKKTADRILSFNPSEHAKILDLQHPISRDNVIVAYGILSSILSPEGNIGVQYELAQIAHDCE